MGTTIGEVSINLRMSMAQFRQDTQQGVSAATTGAKQMAGAFRSSSQEAKASLALLSEEVGINVPRHLRNVIAVLPGVGTALNAVFSSVALIAFLEVLNKIVEKIQATRDAIETADGAMQKLNASFADDIQKLTTTHGAWVDLGNAISKASEEYYKAQRAQTEASSGMFAKVLDVTGIGYAFDFYKGKLQKLTETTHGAVDAHKALLDDIAQIAKTQGPQAALSELTNRLSMLGMTLKGSDLAIQDVAAHLKSELSKELEASTKKAEAFRKELEGIMAGLSKLPAISRTHMPNLGLPSGDETGMLSGPLSGLQAPPQPAVYSGTKEAMELYKISTDQNEAIKQAELIYTKTRKAGEMYANEMAILNQLLKDGRIDQDTYNRAVKDAKLTHDTLSAGFHQLGVNIADTIKQATLFGRGWTDALKSIGVQLAELIIKMIFLKNTANAGSSSSGIGGMFSSILGGLFGGGKESGGPVDPKHWYMVGEHGPETFIPKTSGTIVPHAPASSSEDQRPIQFVQHVHGVVDVDSFQKSHAQIAADMMNMLGVAHRRNR